MKSKFIGILGLLAMTVQFAGCSNMGDNQQVGAVTGGVVGGLLGSGIGSGSGRTAAIIGGSIVGSMIGGNVGYDIDQANRMKVARALETTRLNHSRSWVDSQTGYRYTVKPVKTFHKKGRLCRNYESSVVIDGRMQQAKGLACRDQNENWVIVN